MRLFLILHLLTVCLGSFAQQNTKFGDVRIEDLFQNTYAADSSAEALVLFEKGVIHFLYEDNRTLGYYIESKIHVRKKILKASGLDEHAVAIIPYYQGSTGYEEQIADINASVYNIENGQMVKRNVGSKGIFSEKIQDNYFQKTILFPNAKEGSIIEYEYIMRSPMAVRDKPHTWYFQESIPKLWSQLEVYIPSVFFYKIISSGYLPLHINKAEESNASMGHTWLDGKKATKLTVAVKDAPAFKDEPFITVDDDYLMKIDFELAETALPQQPVKTYSVTWQDIDKTLLSSENWGGRLKKINFPGDELAALKDIGDLKERLNKAHQYMTSAYKWNGRKGLWVHESLKKIVENKTGSASELNMLMLAFLRELDFEAHPAILSTRSNGKIDQQFPLLDKFNYTLVMVELAGEKILVDITDPLLKPGSIPHDCLSNQGRVIRPKNGEIIQITDKDKYRELESFGIKFDPKQGKMLGNYSNQSAGYIARNLRAEYLAKGEGPFQKAIADKFTKVKVNNLQLKNFDDIYKNTEIAFDFESEEAWEEQDVIYIDPMQFGKIEKNPFLKKSRSYPIDFGHLTEQTVMGTISIPDGYEIEELPKNVAINLPESAGRYTYLCSEDQKEIRMVSKLVLNKTVFTAGYYESLKDFYQKIIQKQGEQIILKKKK